MTIPPDPRAKATMDLFDSLRPPSRRVLATHPCDWDLTTIPASYLRGGSDRLRRRLDQEMHALNSDGEA